MTGLIGDAAYDPAAAAATLTRSTRRSPISEAAVCRAVDDALARRSRCYILNITGSVEQMTGTPDRVGVVDGRAFACEIKRPGERPTRRQLVELRRWQDGGALVGWVESAGQLAELLARVHDGRWTNPLTGPGDPTLGETTHGGLADAATAGDP